MISVGIITAIGTSIVAPVLAYLKIRGERDKTRESRDVERAMVEKRLGDLEKQVCGLEEMRKDINQMNLTLTRISTILEMAMQKTDK